MNIKNTTLGALVLLALIVVLIIVFPYMLIWSLNTLFPVLAIEFNFYTWGAAYWILFFLNFFSLVKK